MSKSFLSVIAVAVLALSLAGCPKGTAGLATASDTIAHALADAEKGVDLAVANNQASTVEQAQFHALAAQVSQGGKDLDSAIRSGATAATISAKANVFLELFKKLSSDGVAGIKNPNVQLGISTALNGAEAALSVIQAQVGGTQ
jgi:hypothetical protein